MNKRFTEKFTIMKFWLVEKNHTTITWLENNNNLMTHFLGKTPNALNTSSRFSENVTLCSLAYEQESPILEPDLVRPPRWNVRCWVVLNANQPPLTISCISIDVVSSTTSQTSSVLSYNEMAILFAFPRLNFQTLFKVSNQFSPNLVRCLVSSLSVFTELEGNNPN